MLLNPDLILAWEIASVRTSYPYLSQISPTALVPWQGTSSWQEHFNFLAEALGKEAIAQQAWNHYHPKKLRLKA